MINDILQWAMLSVLAVLTLGAYRWIAETREGHSGSLEASSGPPIGSRVDRRLLSQIGWASGDGSTLIAFVEEGCAGCHALLARLERFRSDIPSEVAVVAKYRTDLFETALHRIPRIQVVGDQEGRLWSEMSVRATPLLIEVDKDRRIARKAVTHDPLSFYAKEAVA